MKLQVALDTLTLQDCIALLEETKGSVDIAEVGTPFVIEEGMVPVKEFKKRGVTKFTKDNFVEEIEFDYLEIHIIEE